MKSPGSASLRDIYANPSSSWSFVPPSTNDSSPFNVNAAPAEHASVHQWSTRIDFPSGLKLEPSTPASAAQLWLKSAFAYAFLQYSSTAVAMPWEIGKTLLQVQYVPRNLKLLEETGQPPDEDEYMSEEESPDSNGNDDAYFADESASSASRSHSGRRTDEQGYVVRQSLADNSAYAEYVLPVGCADGVWSMIKRLGRWKPEGWLALFKGLLTSCAMNLLSTAIQPAIQSILSSTLATIFPSSDFLIRQNFAVPIVANLITGVILSPLDLVRTRLIVQSSVSHHRRYSGPLDALSQILRDEGGLRGVYLHSQLLYPTLLDYTLRPLAELTFPSMIARSLGSHMNEDTHPILWNLTQFVGYSSALLVTLPIETVRRRLQVQTRGSAAPLKTCVEVRRRTYYGIVDTLYTILSEERSDLPVKTLKRRGSMGLAASGRQRKKEMEFEGEDTDGGWLRQTGLGQLYRGIGMRISASAIVFLLQMFMGPSDMDSGWTEL